MSKQGVKPGMSGVVSGDFDYIIEDDNENFHLTLREN